MPRIPRPPRGPSALLALAAILAGGTTRADPAPEAPAAVGAPSFPVFPLLRVVPKGEARGIAFFTSLLPDCSVEGPVVVRTLAPPRHGRLSFVEANAFTRYASASPLAVCNTRKVAGLRMVYEAAEGFEGIDAFRVFVINADGTGQEYDVKVSVR